MNSCADIAEAAAAALNSDEHGVEFSIQFEAEFADQPPGIDRTLGRPRVVLYGIDEGEETPFDRGGGVKATRVANVLLECPLGERYSIAMCLAWLNEVKEALRELVLLERWYHDGTETVTVYDADRALEHKRFTSLFKATFFDFA